MEITTRREDLDFVKILGVLNLNRNDFTFGVAPSNIQNKYNELYNDNQYIKTEVPKTV